MAGGLSNQQIANRLGVSINTVKVHLRNVFAKIGAASRTEATMYAVRAGIVAIEPYEPNPASPDLTTEPPPIPSIDEVQSSNFSGALEQQGTVQISSPSPEENMPAAQTVTPQPETATIARIRGARPSRGFGLGLALLAGLLVLGIAVAASWQAGWLARATGAALSSGDASGLDDRGRWKELSDVGIPRAAFAIANVGDLIYVVGGENQESVVNSVERYDPRFGTWTDLSRKPTPVADVHAVVLGGKLYVPGGRRSKDPRDISKVFEQYDPRTETWAKLPDLPQPRSAYTLAALEGKLYLIGGWDGKSYRREVFEYDPDRGAWREQSPMPTPRAFMDGGVVEDSIYVLGGENETAKGLTSNEVYTPSSEGDKPWGRRAPLPTPRSRFGISVVLSIIHVVGGSPSGAAPIKYNVRTDSWQSFAAPSQPVGLQPGVVLLDTRLLTIGGEVKTNTYSTKMVEYQALFTIALPRQ